MIKKILSIYIFLITTIQITQAQKTFHLSITFPFDIETKDVKISYDNGKEIIIISDSFYKNKITISGKFYSRYAAVMFEYPNTLKSQYYNEFFIQTKPARILFTCNKKDSFNNPLDKFKAINAFEIKKIDKVKRIQIYTSRELNDYEDFYNKFENEISSNDSILELANKKESELFNKKLEYIKKNGNDYFSFWIFRTELLSGLVDSNATYLLKVFNEVFPSKYKNSIEGKEIRKTLHGFLFTKKNYSAPNFSTKDITGKTVSLINYRGRYVLLNFWASWCSPCMKEVPMIKKLRETYSRDQLKIIGVSSDSDKSAFANAIKKNKMNWIHIFGDKNFNKLYGNKPIPSLYLIDKKGVIIYSNWENSYEDLTSLLSALLGNKL